MALRDYLAGEVGEDWADGLITRREAVRRLALLGLSSSAAAALLAACAPASQPSSSSSSPPGATGSSNAGAARLGRYLGAW